MARLVDKLTVEPDVTGQRDRDRVVVEPAKALDDEADWNAIDAWCLGSANPEREGRDQAREDEILGSRGEPARRYPSFGDSELSMLRGISDHTEGDLSVGSALPGDESEVAEANRVCSRPAGRQRGGRILVDELGLERERRTLGRHGRHDHARSDKENRQDHRARDDPHEGPNEAPYAHRLSRPRRRTRTMRSSRSLRYIRQINSAQQGGVRGRKLVQGVLGPAKPSTYDRNARSLATTRTPGREQDLSGAKSAQLVPAPVLRQPGRRGVPGLEFAKPTGVARTLGSATGRASRVRRNSWPRQPR